MNSVQLLYFIFLLFEKIESREITKIENHFF
jgi:hypothetical protein